MGSLCVFRVYLNAGNMASGKRFLPDEAISSLEYFAYCKEKWCTAGGKGSLFGRVGGFIKSPSPPAVDHGDRCDACRFAQVGLAYPFIGKPSSSLVA